MDRRRWSLSVERDIQPVQRLQLPEVRRAAHGETLRGTWTEDRRAAASEKLGEGWTDKRRAAYGTKMKKD